MNAFQPEEGSELHLAVQCHKRIVCLHYNNCGKVVLHHCEVKVAMMYGSTSYHLAAFEIWLCCMPMYSEMILSDCLLHKVD